MYKESESQEQTAIQLRLPLPVEAYGNPWNPDAENPATVPIPNAVIMTRIEGPFTERDRKLWTFLVHAIWDELLTERYHEISVKHINRVFHDLGGEKTASWIWESARRLSRTIVEWEEKGPDSERLQGVSNLMNAKISRSARETGILWFEIPAILSEVIRHPSRFSRIRLHFMIGLSGKYAVTLYELLESAVNMRNPVLEADLDRLRQWLKVPDGKLLRYVDLKRRVLEPAIKQINDDPEGSGFTVEMKAVKKGRAVRSIRFTMKKTAGRIEEEKKIGWSKGKTEAEIPMPGARACCPADLPESAWEEARRVAPGYDVQFLAVEWSNSVRKTGIEVKHPKAHFVAFCKSRAEKKPLR